LQFFDIRSTNQPVLSILHGSDEAPPNVLQYSNFHYKIENNEVKKVQLIEKDLSVCIAYSPERGGDAMFLQFDKNCKSLIDTS